MATAWLDADWPAPRNVRAFTTLRHGLGESAAPFDHFNLGNRAAADGDDPVTVERNRALLAQHAGLPSPPRWLRQVHGVDVVRFDARDFDADDPATGPIPNRGEESVSREAGYFVRTGAGAAGADADSCEHIEEPDVSRRDRSRVAFGVAAEPEADAAVTATPRTVLAILTADCLPVLLCSIDGREVAATHAGWRGLADGVLEATIQAMHTPADRLRAWLGPAAGPGHYEVGVEVYDAFVARDWAAGRAFTSTRPHHWRVDLYALARQRLVKAGLTADGIHGGDLCTIADPQRFYSHRRDRRTGRMASLIWIEPGR